MSVLIVLHVFIAISSLVYATYVFASPSAAKLKISYGLIGGTFASGTILVISQPAHILSVCITGLAYLSAVLVETFAAHYRMTSKSK